MVPTWGHERGEENYQRLRSPNRSSGRKDKGMLGLEDLLSRSNSFVG
jgi:hypothetical protein